MSTFISSEQDVLTLVGKGLAVELAAKLRKQLNETVLEPLVKEAVKDLIQNFTTYHRLDQDRTEVHVHLKRSTL